MQICHQNEREEKSSHHTWIWNENEKESRLYCIWICDVQIALQGDGLKRRSSQRTSNRDAHQETG
jgi:hypothetical protein